MAEKSPTETYELEGEEIVKTLCFSAKLTFALFILGTLSVVAAQSTDYEQEAEQILDATGIKGGLIVHIGCGEGKLTAALHVNDRFLVHVRPSGVS